MFSGFSVNQRQSWFTRGEKASKGNPRSARTAGRCGRPAAERAAGLSPACRRNRLRIPPSGPKRPKTARSVAPPLSANQLRWASAESLERRHPCPPRRSPHEACCGLTGAVPRPGHISALRFRSSPAGEEWSKYCWSAGGRRSGFPGSCTLFG